MKQLNFFNKESDYYAFRWLIVAFAIATAVMVWYDFTGNRIFYSTPQQQWSNSGPGYHK
ncbi:MAG: hypothetical protein J0G98_19100 [Terrimonas ferruginea]|jgi:hypothetical protein|uniref:hypothetical protein n=1 Tax=Terrimonas ferruginea TaxID=249 RepID=UPI000A825FD8|nr:hypothetical protein [Terrimonas ferruginea]MBN8785176.1 hypothetical protein [Terrimonas ferruginea]